MTSLSPNLGVKENGEKNSLPSDSSVTPGTVHGPFFLQRGWCGGRQRTRHFEDESPEKDKATPNNKPRSGGHEIDEIMDLGGQWAWRPSAVRYTYIKGCYVFLG